MTQDLTLLKQRAAEHAVDCYIDSGMIVGLGYGSTASLAVRYLAQKLASGVLTDIKAVACGVSVEKQATEYGIPLTTLENVPRIDVTIDGADEIDPNLNLIKGGGGALLREKIVAQATQHEIIIVDEGKLVPVLGTRWALPIEVIPFGWGSQTAYLKELGGQPHLRLKPDQTPFITDQGNYILDCQFGPIHNLSDLAAQLAGRAGIVEHGLFLGLAHTVIVAEKDRVYELRQTHNKPEI